MYHFLNKKFAEAIIDKRSKDGTTLREAAKKSGVNMTTLFRMELGVTSSLQSFVKVCSWLGKKPDSFIETKISKNAK